MYGRLNICLVFTAVLTVAVSGASAGFVDDFESYAAGSQMHGQGGWKGWDNDAAWGALASSAQAYGGTNSVEIAGNSDLVHEFDAVGGQWELSAMQYVPGDSTGETYFILLNQYNDGGPYNWSVQINANLNSGKINAWDVTAGTWHGDLDVVRDQWVEIKAVVDLDANTLSQYYNGTLMHTGAWYGADPSIAAIDLFANGAGPVYYDNLSLVPEPGTLVMLLGVGVGALLVYFRRRR